MDDTTNGVNDSSNKCFYGTLAVGICGTVTIVGTIGTLIGLGVIGSNNSNNDDDLSS